MRMLHFLPLALSLMAATSANASLITTPLDVVFDGTAPSAVVSLTVDDSAVDTLTYTLDLSALAGAEHLKEFYFNLDPFVTPLTWDLSDTTAAWASYGEGLDAFKAGPDGFFDYILTFDNSNRLSGGEVYTFSIMGAGLDIADVLSLSAGPSGGLYFAAHIDGIGSNVNQAGWVTGTPRGGSEVPLPFTPALLGVGLAGLWWSRRKTA